MGRKSARRGGRHPSHHSGTATPAVSSQLCTVRLKPVLAALLSADQVSWASMSGLARCSAEDARLVPISGHLRLTNSMKLRRLRQKRRSSPLAHLCHHVGERCCSATCPVSQICTGLRRP